LGLWQRNSFSENICFIFSVLVLCSVVSLRTVRTAAAEGLTITRKKEKKKYNWIFTRERLEDADHLVVKTLSGEQLGCFCGNFQVG
jgi:hypothetical protein